jgi:hypothetical protein
VDAQRSGAQQPFPRFVDADTSRRPPACLAADLVALALEAGDGRREHYAAAGSATAAR